MKLTGAIQQFINKSLDMLNDQCTLVNQIKNFKYNKTLDLKYNKTLD